MRKPLLFIVTGIALIFIIIVSAPFSSFAIVNPVVSSCNNFTNAATATIMNCSLSVTSGDIIVTTVTCEGCSGVATPITNDSQSNSYHDFTNYQGAAQIGVIGVANISASGSLVVSGQIRDSAARSFWGMGAADVHGASNLIGKYSSGIGSSAGGQSNINVASTSWTNQSVVIFESADANGFTPTCTNQFILFSSSSSLDNGACYNYNYTTAQSPSTFTMGAGGTTFAEQALVIPYIPGPTTITTTLTVTAWNTIGTNTPSTWIVLSLMLFFLPALTWGVLKGFQAKPSTTIFATLVSLFAGSFIAVIGGFEAGASASFPFAVAIANGIFLVIFIFRSRARTSF